MKKRNLLFVALFSSLITLGSCTNSSSTTPSDVDVNSSNNPISKPSSSVSDAPNSSTDNNDDNNSSSTSSSTGSEFETISIAEARALPTASEVTVTGEVIKVLYAQGGNRIAYVYIYDGTAGIVLYPNKNQTFPVVEEGNHIVVNGSTDYYQGMYELTTPTILDNDDDTNLDIDESWIIDSTAAEVNALTDEESLNIYRVPCKATKSDQYNVYYLNDTSSDISLQTYSQNGYVEYEFLDEHLDESMYVVFMYSLQKNTKHYVLPLYYDGAYTVSQKDEIDKVLPEVTNGLTTVYYENASFTLPKVSVDNPVVTFSYTSSDPAVSFSDESDFIKVDVKATKDFTITATGHLGDETSSTTINFEVRQKNNYDNLVPIADLRKQADGTKVKFEGDVIGFSFDSPVGSRYNSYYIGDETGSIRVTLTATDASKMLLGNGEHVVMEGTVDVYSEAGNTLTIDDVNVLYHDSKDNGLPFEPVTKTFDEMNNFVVDSADNRAGDVFYMTFKLFSKKNTYGSDTLYYSVSLDGTEADVGGHEKSKVFYSSGGSDLSYLDEYVGHTVKGLIGIRDVKSGQSYYRYDCLNGYLEIVE